VPIAIMLDAVGINNQCSGLHGHGNVTWPYRGCRFLEGVPTNTAAVANEQH